MITAMELVHRRKQNISFLADFEFENPVVLQLGGSCPIVMKDAALIAQKYGYKEININVGCPSPKVAGAGSFGASLMLEPYLVAQIAAEIRNSTGLPTTVKCRIGINEQEDYTVLANFVRVVHSVGGVNHFIVHARNAVLNRKFSPADNREIPPLKYPVVHSLCHDFSNLDFTINGGITDLNSAKEQLNKGVSGVMVGRAFCSDPYQWSSIDSVLYGDNSASTLCA